MGERPRIVVEPPGPKARELIERDVRVGSPSLERMLPLVSKEAHGVWVKDVDENVFLDFSSGVAVANLGHAHPEVVETIRQSAEKATFLNCHDFYSEVPVTLMEKLCEITPGKFEKRIFLSNSGAEAVECAIKLCQWHTGKLYMISFLGGFHGKTLGALQLTTTSARARRRFRSMIPGVVYAPYPYCYRCPFKLEYPSCGLWCVGFIEEEIFEKIAPPDEISCLIVEPIQGAAGYIVPPPEFLRELKKLCGKYGIIFIADEVQTGFCRTGRWFACEHWQVEPDVVTLSKAIASGLPLGATVSRAELMDWEPGSHENTLGGNAMICEVALKTIEILKRERLDKNAEKVGGQILERLSEIASEHEVIGDVRGKGLMIAVEFVEDREKKTPAEKFRDAVLLEAFKQGLIAMPAGRSSMRIAPPLIITPEQAEIGIEIFEQAIKKVEKTLG